jgi:hypothetical protein
VGSTTTREPEFDPLQVSLLLGFQELDGDRGSHGQPMSEATSVDADPAVLGTYHYEANQFPIVDRAAKALADAQNAYYDRYPKAPREGHVWVVKKVVD